MKLSEDKEAKPIKDELTSAFDYQASNKDFLRSISVHGDSCTIFTATAEQIYDMLQFCCDGNSVCL